MQIVETDIKIKMVEFQDDFHIYVYLSNGEQIIYDLKPKLKTARFRELSDKAFFKKGYVESEMIRWDVNTEISLDEILLQTKTQDYKIKRLYGKKKLRQSDKGENKK